VKKFKCIYGLGECAVVPRILEAVKTAAKMEIPEDVKAVAPELAKTYRPYAEWILKTPEAFIIHVLPHFCMACPTAKKATLGE